jgi:hypothetical protein
MNGRAAASSSQQQIGSSYGLHERLPNLAFSRFTSRRHLSQERRSIMRQSTLVNRVAPDWIDSEAHRQIAAKRWCAACCLDQIAPGLLASECWSLASPVTYDASQIGRMGAANFRGRAASVWGPVLTVGRTSSQPTSNVYFETHRPNQFTNGSSGVDGHPFGAVIGRQN